MPCMGRVAPPLLPPALSSCRRRAPSSSHAACGDAGHSFSRKGRRVSASYSRLSTEARTASIWARPAASAASASPAVIASAMAWKSENRLSRPDGYCA